MAASESIKVLILSLVVTPFIIFQISVIVFIAYAKMIRKKFYDTSFFTLFLMLTIIDTVAEIGTIYALNFPGVPAFEFLFVENRIAASALYQLSSYTLFTQCYIHCGIAINRFWAVMMTLAKGHHNIERFGKYCIWAIPFITIPFIVPRFWFDANFVRDPTGRLWPAYFESKEVKMFINTYSATLCFFSSLFSFVLQIATAIKYKMLLKNNSAQTSKVYQEIRFLGQAMIALAAQMFMCILQLMMFIATYTENADLNNFAFQNFMWCQNVSNLSVPIALLLIGKRIRNDWWTFLSRKETTNISNVKTTTSSTANNNNNNNRTMNTQRKLKKNKVGTVVVT